MKREYLLSATALFSSFVLTLSSKTVSAGDFAYGLGYIGEYRDNIRQVSENPEREWINSAVGRLSYREIGSTFDAFLLGQAEYRDYKYDIFNDGPIYFLDTSANWRIVPRTLVWTVVDRYDQVTRDVTRSDTPDNRVNANVFNTGPDLMIRIGPVNTVVLAARYGRATYSDNSDISLDNSRVHGAARWQYAVSRDTTFSLNYEIEDVQYENELLNDSGMKQDVFLRASTRRAHTRFEWDLGGTKFNRDRAGESTGYLARLAFSQQLNARSSAGINLASEYMDAGTALLSTSQDPSTSTDPSVASYARGEATSDYFNSKRAEVFYNNLGGTITMNLRAFYNDIDYEITPQDRRLAGWNCEFSYRPSTLFSASLLGSHIDTRYDSFDREDRDSDAGIRFSYRLTRYLGASLEGRRVWRYSTEAEQEFVDHRVPFSLFYSSGTIAAVNRR